MRTFDQAEYTAIDASIDPSGATVTGDRELTPGGPSPYRTQNVLPLTGWPYGGVWPCVNYPSRYILDKAMLETDLALADATIYLTDFPSHAVEYVISSTYKIEWGNISFEWNSIYPEGSVEEIGGTGAYGEFTSQILSAPTDIYRILDFGTDTIDLSKVSNHYAVEYYAIERGRGTGALGFFYADVAGDWEFAIDGTDILEVFVDDVIVFGRYTTGIPSSDQSKNGIISLTQGWIKYWAYSSATTPTIWYKRPGDSVWSYMTDGLDWSTPDVVYNPARIEFSVSGSDLVSELIYNDTDSVTHNIPFADVTEDTPLTLSTDTKPRAQVYYMEGWRDSTVSKVFSAPPAFVNMRVVTRYNPLVETMSFEKLTLVTPTYFLVSKDGINWQNYKSGSFSSILVVDDIDDLRGKGNTAYELADISDSDWTTYMGALSSVYLCFTGQSPIFVSSPKKILNLASNEYALVIDQPLGGDLRFDKDEL